MYKGAENVRFLKAWSHRKGTELQGASVGKRIAVDLREKPQPGIDSLRRRGRGGRSGFIEEGRRKERTVGSGEDQPLSRKEHDWYPDLKDQKGAEILRKKCCRDRGAILELGGKKTMLKRAGPRKSQLDGCKRAEAGKEKLYGEFSVRERAEKKREADSACGLTRLKETVTSAGGGEKV